ncbi:protein serine/threonine phosphatase with extracellular sensor [Pseudodesulfovibrio mercurii]|uniref:Protein serine/threonine phosphatase with extracellular sensor n=1 Tax=Pseudodesulfovibrio mercurii TaxID=641491 RepID=F0JGF9_9BACT|nr:SpoIIE family protein phosphatase [Pseudodesulfovibrio mercurii]EGB15076.1 protein serine/threonine phosphatase with extracellular sensor [Pseudodesulfovibrio mercurii]
MRAEPAMPAWRPALYYALTVAGGAVYGGKVCAYMAHLPTWKLGLVILGPLAVAWLVRGSIERRVVERARPLRRALRQFQMEMSLFLAAGLASAAILTLVYHYPFVQSGLMLIVGMFAAGLFAGLDLALARERQLIRRALAGDALYTPPDRPSTMTRKFTVFAILILVLSTAVILLVLVRNMGWLATQALNLDTLDMVGRSILTEVLIVMGFLIVMVANLVISYSRNMRMIFENQTRVLENVSRGDLSHRVPVPTSDEMGVIAAHTNTMIMRLREGMRMREGLRIAQEVQQHFLPRKPPHMPGLDIAGVSLFSDETGGDFYDFIECDLNHCDQLAVAVGDVSGHGIGAALLMTAGRAVIRQNAATPGPAAENIRRANLHLARDIGDTGRFMTLFFMVIDPLTKRITWINAGHPPPQVYDPAMDAFDELKGADIPLGVEPDWTYHEQVMDLPAPGRILCICTDGVCEARNRDGAMFGRERIREILRDNRDRSAREIVAALSERVLAFAGPGRREDDLTLVVIKGAPR